MFILITSIAVLAVGPLVYHFSRHNQKILVLIDAFSSTVIFGLILLEILPELYVKSGSIILLPIALGLFLPSLIEKYFIKFSETAHKATLVFALLGLTLHSLLDGFALEKELFAGHISETITLSVILHRLPVAIIIWWLVRPKYSKAFGFAILGLIAINTVVGFYLGQYMVPLFSGLISSLFQGLVVGALLHIIFHRVERNISESHGIYSGFGAGIGLVLVAVLLYHHQIYNSETFKAFYHLLGESAPALLLGYFLAGVLNVMMPASYVKWLQKGKAMRQAMKGMVVGLPLPVCSCGVIPIYEGLVKRGAPLAASLAFLVATPELGIDAIILSIPLLGFEMTAIRVGGAAILALVVGYLVKRFFGKDESKVSEVGEAEHKLTGKEKIKKVFHFGFIEVVDHTGPWLLLGLIIAALVQAFVSFEFMASFSPIVAVSLFALAGIPMYVCAAGATPLVAIFLLKGISPGAALAFLLTGPATNVTTFGLLSKLHGKKITLAFSVAVITVAILLGVGVDYTFSSVTPGSATLNHAHGLGPWQIGSLIILTLIFAFSFVRRGPRAFLKEIISPFSDHDHSHEHHNHDEKHQHTTHSCCDDNPVITTKS